MLGHDSVVRSLSSSQEASYSTPKSLASGDDGIQITHAGEFNIDTTDMDLVNIEERPYFDATTG